MVASGPNLRLISLSKWVGDMSAGQRTVRSDMSVRCHSYNSSSRLENVFSVLRVDDDLGVDDESIPRAKETDRRGVMARGKTEVM